VELGGTDQIFNLLLGREIQKDFSQEPQVIITMPLLEGTDGVQKMSKTYANFIGINEGSSEMFGKIMSISDDLMMKYYTLLTDADLGMIRNMHPKEAKLGLAEEIVACYHPKSEARQAREEFQRVFSQKETPHDIAVYRLAGPTPVIEILIQAKLVASKNEARRLIAQGAVVYNDQPVASEDAPIDTAGILKVGKRRFLKLER
jgi:tyrosyl-tRNA synthetase